MNERRQFRELTSGLTREYFVCPDVYARETERIFGNSWIYADRVEQFDSNGHSSERFRTIDLDGSNVLIVNKADGSFRAFHNVCRHRGTRLIDEANGEISNSCVTCPYHAWTYDLDGQLIGAPNMTDAPDFHRQHFSLDNIGCVNWAGFLMLNLAKDDSEFDSDLRPIVERMTSWDLNSLRLASTLTYEVNANWKLLFQNYSECYHCPTVHPDLSRLTPYKSAENDLQEGAILGGPMKLADGIETVSSNGKRIGEPFPQLDDNQRTSVYYYTVFPNMFVNAHPDYVAVYRLNRLGVDCTEVICDFLVAPESDDTELERATELWDQVNRQDWHVCELTQKGVTSPAYKPGPYSNLETMLAAFDRHYLSAIGDL